MAAPSDPNRDQARLWNDAAGQTWVELQDLLDRIFASVGRAIVEAGFPGEGGRVLDVGCGAGATTLAMARRLGPGGECLGVDISRPLIEAARRRPGEPGAASAQFIAADAQQYAFAPAAFDAAISRFGVMFFDDPIAAFRNIRQGVRHRGRLAFAAWRNPAENPFMTAAARAAGALIPDLPTPRPDAPGQFAFASADLMREILDNAGWTDPEIRPMDLPGALEGRELDLYIASMGPVGLALRAMDEESRAPVREAIRRAFDPFVHDGVAHFSMACWLVTATA